ncbi:MAG: tetratricopeptide repeat protein, partial [Desulfobacterales bacterium]|nr:tetratricopeptide repeat protein [Desulfobacterales bacterium]
MAQHKYSLALKELIKAEKIYSDDHILQNDLGIAYMGKERIDLAIPCFKRAIELKPDFAVAKNNLGTAYIAHEEWDLAIEVLESIFEDLFYATPHYPHANMGWAYFNKRDFPEAEKHYLQALEIEPNFSVALRGLGRTYMRQGKNEEAVKTLGKAVKLSPGPAKGEA